MIASIRESRRPPQLPHPDERVDFHQCPASIPQHAKSQQLPCPYIHMHTCRCMHACMQTDRPTDRHTYTHTHARIHTYTDTHICRCSHTQRYVHMFIVWLVGQGRSTAISVEPRQAIETRIHTILFPPWRNAMDWADRRFASYTCISF